MISSDKQKIKAIKIIVAIIGISAVLSVAIYILFKNFFGDGGESGLAFRELVQHNPVVGALVMVAATAVQVVIAFIPGELLEQVSGYLFGSYLGATLSLAGSVLGSVLVLIIVRRFGRSLVYAIYPPQKIESVSFLRSGKKRNILTAFVFFIPGTPKDLLTYVVGLTDMSISTYLLLTTLARIPSILMSTVSGDLIADMLGGEQALQRILFLNGAALVLAAVGYIVYTIINQRHRAVHPRRREKSCGAVVFTRIDGEIKYLIIKSLAGVYGFPKGHVEDGETEKQTASREILEETALTVEFVDGFRAEDSYTIKDEIDKTVVYFLARFEGESFSKQDSEIETIELLSFEEAQGKLQFDSTRRVLTEANDFLMKLN